MWNKSINIVLIVVLSIIAIALISIMILAIINKDFKISLFSFGDRTKLLVEKEFDISQIKNIEINVDSPNVKVVEGSHDKAKVTIYGLEDEQYNVNLEENNLKVNKDKKVFHMFVFMAWARQEVVVELPKEYSGDIRRKSIKWKYTAF